REATIADRFRLLVPCPSPLRPGCRSDTCSQLMREPPDSVQPEGTTGGDSQTAVDSGARCVRLRQHERRVPAGDSDGVGNAKLLANGITPRLGGKEAIDWNAQQLRRIDLRWHDLRHEGACRLLSDGVDISIIQLMLGHANIQQTQRCWNVTDGELRKGLRRICPRDLEKV